MDPPLPRTSTTLTLTCLLSLFLSIYTISVSGIFLDRTGLSGLVLYASILGLVLAAMTLLLLVAARATMVAWITVLVLLAFSGKRRHVLARQGRRITADVAVHLVKVVLRERGLVALICAAAVSFMAVVGVREM